jgi:hypothetical protein
LQQLRERNDILLAIPTVAKDAYASIVADFPVVYYDDQLSATDVLNVLRASYDDFAQRLANVDVNAVQASVREVGLVPEQACYGMLHCYRRSELQQAATLVVTDDITYIAGIGLYTSIWFAHIKRDFLEWMQGIGETTLSSALEWLRTRNAILRICSDEILEALIERWTEFHIERNSIFDAMLRVIPSDIAIEPTSSLHADSNGVLENAEAVSSPSSDNSTLPGSKRERRSTVHTGRRKRLVRETQEGQQTTQEYLWGE